MDLHHRQGHVLRCRRRPDVDGGARGAAHQPSARRAGTGQGAGRDRDGLPVLPDHAARRDDRPAAHRCRRARRRRAARRCHRRLDARGRPVRRPRLPGRPTAEAEHRVTAQKPSSRSSHDAESAETTPRSCGKLTRPSTKPRLPAWRCAVFRRLRAGRSSTTWTRRSSAACRRTGGGRTPRSAASSRSQRRRCGSGPSG